METLELNLGNSTMDCISFGEGEQALIILPGITPQGITVSAAPTANRYRIFAERYHVYILDRKRDIPEDYTIRELAQDASCAIKALGLRRVDVLGISQGGMIAQFLAIDHPELVRRLVLGVTMARGSDAIHSISARWIELAGQNDYEALLIDMMETMYSEGYVQKCRKMLPILVKNANVGPKELTRFIRLLKACTTFRSYDELDQIQCPVFVIGAEQDKVLTGQASRDLAEKLNCGLYMYPDQGHSAYEEARDFNSRALRFLEQ